jgi:xylulokinase
VYRPAIATDLVLAIDLGTGGPKAAVVDSSGRTIAWSSVGVATTSTSDGGAEQDPEQMWSAVVEACRTTLAACDRPAEVDAIAVTSQYMSVVPVRRDGTPTGPCIMWMDTRGAANNRALLDEDSVPLFLERHGLMPLPSGNDNVAHISVLRDHHPAAYAAADAFVEPMDYINARITGRVCATQSTSFSTLCCDNRTWGTIEHDPELVAASGLDPAKLAPLVPMNGFVGEVTSAAAEALGIAAGIPVTAATIDSITSAIGTGALGPTEGSVVIGTTSVLVSHIDEKRGDLMGGILAVPSPLTGMYYVMAENGVGGRALEWFLRSVVYPDDAYDTPAPTDIYDRAMAAAASVAAGSGGAQFLPWLLGSIAPHPNDDVRAAFTGLGLAHTRSHLTRAVLEGVALNLAWLLPYVEAFVGNEFPVLRFGGGGAMSPLWAQILADATGRPVDRLDQPRATNARGAAFLAFAELGVLDIHDTPELLRVAEHHKPDPAHRDAMDAALNRLAALHPALALHNPRSSPPLEPNGA